VIREKLRALKDASISLRSASSKTKNQVLKSLSAEIKKNRKLILRANEKDLACLKVTHLAFTDRLVLNDRRLNEILKSLDFVTSFKDPVGEITEKKILKNGLRAFRVRAPLGVIFIIFESRPNVVIEAFSLAFKAGNSLIMKGGKESAHTCRIFYRLIEKALIKNGLSPSTIWGIEKSARAVTAKLLKAKNEIDIVVPRGGEKLIDRGLCHIYVDADANLYKALKIVTNAKAQRPGVCNSLETVLVHKLIAHKFIPMLYENLKVYDMEWFVCPFTAKILASKKNVKKATPNNWSTEYLDFKINCRVVSDMTEALDHISKHGSKHSEGIITKNRAHSEKFLNSVDAAAVYLNASTRFTDGFELGLGGELGISTQKLHVRGPVGLNELTSVRWIIKGTGQIRK
jgi:glutamate-5-semialdehyde dehydrogenase